MIRKDRRLTFGLAVIIKEGRVNNNTINAPFQLPWTTSATISTVVCSRVKRMMSHTRKLQRLLIVIADEFREDVESLVML